MWGSHFIKQHARTLSFLGVLALTSSLVLVLFDEARAVSVSVDDPGVIRMDDGTRLISINVAIPASQLVPITSVKAVIEESLGATRSSPTAVVATATCLGANGCPAPVTTGAKGSAIVSIRGGGNPAAAYGYLSVGGQGYGYGYGYGGATGGTLTFQVEIQASALDAGHHWISFTLVTGSPVIGDITSTPAYFRIAPAPAVATPTPPASGRDLADPTAGGQKPDAVIREIGGIVRAETKVPASSTEKFAVNLNAVDKRLQTLDFAPGIAPPGATVTVRVSDKPFAAESAKPIAEGWKPGTLFLEITVQLPDGTSNQGGDSRSASLAFRLPATDVPGATNSVTLLHFKNGEWIAEETSLVFTVNGEHVFMSQIRGFSPFAVVFDEELPTVSELVPAPGSVVAARPTLSAVLADNRGVDARRTVMEIDGQRVNALVTPTAISFTPVAALTPGEHVARVRATDASGLQTVMEWRFVVDVPLDTPPLTDLPAEPTLTPPDAVPPAGEPIERTSVTPDPTSPTGTKTGVPGLGVVGILAALGAALVVLRRRS